MGELQDETENIQGQERHPIDVKLLKAAREGNTQLLEQLMDEEINFCQPQATRCCDDCPIIGTANTGEHPTRSNHIVILVPDTEATSFDIRHGGHRLSDEYVGGEASTSRDGNRSPSSSDEVMRDGGRSPSKLDGEKSQRRCGGSPPNERDGELSGRHGCHSHVSLTPFQSKLFQGVTSDWDGVLHIAAKLGHVDLVEAISMREGLVVNILAKNKKGETPLHCAAATGNVDIIYLLISMAGEENVMRLLNERNRYGETCLHEAVRWGNKEAAESLIMLDVAGQQYRERCRSRALVQIEDEQGVSPLYLATTLGRFEIVRLLTERRQAGTYSASYTGPEKKTALHAAVLVSKALSKHLMEWNACLVEKADLYGNTPLHLLASTGDTSIADILLRKDERAGYREDAEGSLPIHVAAASGNLDFIQLLLKYCPYCNCSCNNFGQTILHIAVQNRNYKVVRYVCSDQKFVKIFNTRDTDGNTALHLAILQGNQFIFCQLMSRNEVNLNFRNKAEHTPLGLAMLSLPGGLTFKQTPRRWIFYDLVLAGAELDTCRFDHFTAYQKNGPDKETLSEILSKSAGLLAVCAVLILNISFAAPFTIAKFYLDPSTSNTRARAHAFRAMIIADTFAFAFSTAATYCWSFAGLSIIDMRRRSFYLNIGSSCLQFAVFSMVIVFLMGIYSVFAPVDRRITIAASVVTLGAVIPLLSWLPMMFYHFWALYQRLGFQTWCRTLLRRPPQQYRRYHHLGINSLQVIFIILVLCGTITVLSFL